MGHVRKTETGIRRKGWDTFQGVSMARRWRQGLPSELSRYFCAVSFEIWREQHAWVFLDSYVYVQRADFFPFLIPVNPHLKLVACAYA